MQHRFDFTLMCHRRHQSGAVCPFSIVVSRIHTPVTPGQPNGSSPLGAADHVNLPAATLRTDEGLGYLDGLDMTLALPAPNNGPHAGCDLRLARASHLLARQTDI